MGGFWEGGINTVLWLQGNLAFLRPLMHAFSFLGTTEFLLLLGLTVYWCINTRIGIRLGLILISGAAIGAVLKLAFHMPRPYWYDAQVQALAGEPTYGMPSIHALYAWSITPWLAGLVHRRGGWVAGVILAAGISVSRVFLGVHFPVDVLAGMVLGVLVWFLVEAGIRFLGPVLERTGFGMQCLAAASASAVLLLAQSVILQGLEASPDPAEWAHNAARIGTFLPRNPKDILSLAGLILGMGVGLACRNRWAPFRADGESGKRILRFFLGLLVALMLWGGLVFVWNEYAQPFASVLRFTRYGLVGYWTVFLAPWLFLRLGLAEGKTKHSRATP